MERFYKMVEASNKRFPRGVEPYQMVTRLMEECGEVAEVLNQRAGYTHSPEGDLQLELGQELADMIHYIVAIAAINGIDLNAIMLEKDRRASEKYHHDTNLARFLTERADG